MKPSRNVAAMLYNVRAKLRGSEKCSTNPKVLAGEECELFGQPQEDLSATWLLCTAE